MTKNNYQKRGQLPENFMKGLSCYQKIVEISKQPNSGLDLQLHVNKINIYYKGGSLLCLSGKESIYFDEMYFHTPDKDGMRSSDVDKLRKENYLEKLKKRPSASYKGADEETLKEAHGKALEIYNKICGQRDELVNRLKKDPTKEEVEEVLKEMKKQIDDWKGCMKRNGRRKEVKDERSVQHYISLYNKSFNDDTDYLVLDIEYAISAKAPYKKEGCRDREQPRADILAIDRDGQLYVMELKYGKKSVETSKSGAINHIEDFLATMGDNKKWRSFMKDVKFLFENKQKQGLLDKNVKLDCEKPPRFAFIYKKTDNEYNFLKYIRDEYGKDGYFVLYLPVDDTAGEYPALNYKLRKDQICE